MLNVVIVGEPSLFLSLLTAHVEAAPSCTLLTAAHGTELEPVNYPLSTVVLLVARGTVTAEEAADMVTQTHRRYASLPICVISSLSDPVTVQSILRSGARGLVSMASCASSLIPILYLLASGETFVPLSSLAESRLESKAADRGQVARAPKEEEQVRLTARERQVAQVLFRGQSNKEIARELFMRENTVKIHVRSLIKKLGARSRSEAIVLAPTKLSRDCLSIVAEASRPVA